MIPTETLENLEQAPKKKRGRPSKAELEERARLAALAASAESPAESTVSASDEAPAEEAPKRKRIRRTKAEIIAAAEAAAAALVENNQKKAEVSLDAVPEAAFGVGESVTSSGDGEEEEETLGLMERLQSKVQAHNASETSRHSFGPWADAPTDGTDFIIVQDLPVEDNTAIPYYDMFDNPNTSVATQTVVDDSESGAGSASNYDFSDIIRANGLLEIMPDGYGFLRSSDYNYLSSPDDVHLTVQQIRQNFLKTGDVVECTVRPPHGNERYFTMSSIIKVNGRDPRDIRDRISFENLTPLFPEEKFTLCGDPRTTNVSTRIVDLFSPIGKGQRSLIVSQPKTGKTILMKDIANAIAANHPEAYIMMLLIDERPEEVTDMARTVNAEVIASTFDEPADRHVKIAGLVLEKAKRLVECGHDVVIFLDSITRLARAYNTVAPASGKVLTGGVDSNALQKPKRFFGAARNIENGGSLTIIATALTDTGSKMDEVIFEEFKGTGNSELQLDRTLANKRIFPAVNLIASSTRRDDLLHDKMTLDRMWILRKSIADMNSMEAMQQVHNLMTRTRDNAEFFMAMNS
ncbi:MAG: transcription termination factor Rho [Prevotella sp.]|nr:transcription termination factor Rho [Prevotella sp.]